VPAAGPSGTLHDLGEAAAAPKPKLFRWNEAYEATRFGSLVGREVVLYRSQLGRVCVDRFTWSATAKLWEQALTGR
jgi:hypothetical protein